MGRKGLSGAPVCEGWQSDRSARLGQEIPARLLRGAGALSSREIQVRRTTDQGARADTRQNDRSGGAVVAPEKSVTPSSVRQPDCMKGKGPSRNHAREHTPARLSSVSRAVPTARATTLAVQKLKRSLNGRDYR